MNHRCSLCSFLYSDSSESIAWGDLPSDWVCPACGSGRDSFTLDKSPAPHPPLPTPASKARPLKFQCNLCGHIYDEEKEKILWEDLPDDWQCPLCGSTKSQFSLVKETAESTGKQPAKPVFMLDYLAEWMRRFPDAEVHRFSDAGHYVLEDVPEIIIPRVADFLKRHARV